MTTAHPLATAPAPPALFVEDQKGWSFDRLLAEDVVLGALGELEASGSIIASCHPLVWSVEPATLAVFMGLYGFRHLDAERLTPVLARRGIAPDRVRIDLVDWTFPDRPDTEVLRISFLPPTRAPIRDLPCANSFDDHDARHPGELDRVHPVS